MFSKYEEKKVTNRWKSIFICLFLTGFFTGSLTINGAAPLHDEAGFIHIEPITFYFHYGSYFNRLELTSSPARIFYSFHTADENPQDKPLFVFFNGGPGSASSSGLLSMYTTRFTLDNSLDNGGDEFIENPVPWTQMGNLIHIDARQAGFSYNTMDMVNNQVERFREFDAQNFNSFFDGGDFIRVLLRFLALHPHIRGNPVVIVGESYGGTRAITMLHILLNYTGYGNGEEMYQDKSLSEEIQAHYNVVFPGYNNRQVPPGVISGQFGFQILIQPTVTMTYQNKKTVEMLNAPGSVIYQLGEEIGIPFDPVTHGGYYNFVRNIANRDIYMYSKPKDWLNGFFFNAGRLLQSTKNLSLITGTDVTAINEFYASSRANAYRVVDPNYNLTLQGGPAYSAYCSPTSWQYYASNTLAALLDILFLHPARLEAQSLRQNQGDMTEVFGKLKPYDRYFIGTNYYANQAFYFTNVAMVRGYEVVFALPRFGRMFLENLAFVHTFITNAAYDLMIYCPALPPALALHRDILRWVVHRKQEPADAERPGRIILKYRTAVFPGIPDPVTRTIRFPFYDASGHAVSLTQPAAFYNDVSDWLSRNGINKTQPQEIEKNEKTPVKKEK